MLTLRATCAAWRSFFATKAKKEAKSALVARAKRQKQKQKPPFLKGLRGRPMPIVGTCRLWAPLYIRLSAS